MLQSLKTKYHNTTRGIRNLIKWLPVIWRDRDWDQNYLMFMMEKKLYNMSELHHKNGYAEHSQETGEQLKLASVLAGRIAREDYSNDIRIENEELINELKSEIKDNRIDIMLNDKEMKSLIHFINEEERLMQEDTEELFDLMKNNLRNWWD